MSPGVLVGFDVGFGFSSGLGVVFWVFLVILGDFARFEVILGMVANWVFGFFWVLILGLRG